MMNGNEDAFSRTRYGEKLDESTSRLFYTIRETSKRIGLSEKYLRKMHKQKILPGIQTGNRFMVNYPALVRYFLMKEENHRRR